MTEIKVAFPELAALRRAHMLRSELSATIVRRRIGDLVAFEPGVGCRSLAYLCERLSLRMEELAVADADLAAALDRSLDRYVALEAS